MPAVLQRYPHLEFARAMPDLLHGEARRNPAARTALLIRLGLAERIEAAWHTASGTASKVDDGQLSAIQARAH